MLDSGKRCYLYHWQRITIPPNLSKSLIKPLFAPQETKAATRNWKIMAAIFIVLIPNMAAVTSCDNNT